MIGQIHKITDWTLKGHPGHSPCRQLRYLQLGRVAQSPKQPDLDWLHGWDCCHLSGVQQCELAFQLTQSCTKGLFWPDIIQIYLVDRVP